MSDDERKFRVAQVSGQGADYKEMVYEACKTIPADKDIKCLLLAWTTKDGMLSVHTDVDNVEGLIELAAVVLHQVAGVHKEIHEAPERLQ